MSKSKDQDGTTGAGSEGTTEPSDTGTPGDDGVSAQTVGEAIQKEKEVNDSIAHLSEKRVRDLARAEIEHWHANGPKLLQPKTWGKRTQAGAIAGSIVALAVAIFGFFILDANKLSRQLHSFVGTDGRVRDALDDYSRTAATLENPIFRLIGRTMRQAPVLAFHGEITFGRTFEITLPDRECQEWRRQEAKDLASEEFNNLPLPEGGAVISAIDVESLCSIRGPIDFGLDLDIPFHARFFENLSESPPHQAWLVVFIRRTSIENESDLPDEVDNAGQPPGLCFLYKPASPAAGIETLAITNFERTGNGFWSADLTDTLTKAGVWDTPPNNADATTSLHSVVIEDVRTVEDKVS